MQIAKSFGAVVTGACSTRNVEMVLAIGADHVIDYTLEDYTQSGLGYSFQYPWEDYFTVVHWDQRGAGRSIPENGFPVETMTVERMLQDTIELTDYLRGQFGQDKIFVVGYSWGTVLGTLLAKRRPDLLYAYIGFGQLAARQEENFEETRRLLTHLALEQNDQETVDALAAAGPMPAPAESGAYMQWLDTIQSPLLRYGKFWHSQPSSGAIAARMILTTLLSPDLTLNDIQAFSSGKSVPYSLALHQDLYDFDIRSLGYDFDVPVILVMGTHDWTTPITLARGYFQNIEAPYKKFVELEHSAHMVWYEEPGKVFGVLVKDALPFALAGANSESR